MNCLLPIFDQSVIRSTEFKSSHSFRLETFVDNMCKFEYIFLGLNRFSFTVARQCGGFHPVLADFILIHIVPIWLHVPVGNVSTAAKLFGPQVIFRNVNEGVGHTT